MKAVAYRRVSSEDQAQNGLGLDSQKDKVESLAREKGLKIVEWYEDRGLSGSLRNRPGLNRLLVDIEADGITDLVTYSLDRLARNLALSLVIEGELKRRKVNLHTVLETTFDLTDPFQKLIKHSREIFSEFEADMARVRTEAALRKKLSRGEYPKGPAPLGYIWAGEKPHKTLRPGPRAELVKLIFRKYIEFKSTAKLSVFLKDQGEKTPRGGDFSIPGLTLILENKIYLGKFRFSGVEGKLKAIIAPIVWNKAQKILRSRKRSYKKSRRAGKADKSIRKV